VTIFKPRDGGLAGAHPGRKLGLRQARAQASPEQLGGDLELRREGIIRGLDLRVGEQAGLELFKLNGHVISFARRSASSISARCVFFANARMTSDGRGA
jgi:hypothetical protein